MFSLGRVKSRHASAPSTTITPAGQLEMARNYKASGNAEEAYLRSSDALDTDGAGPHLKAAGRCEAYCIKAWALLSHIPEDLSPDTALEQATIAATEATRLEGSKAEAWRLKAEAMSRRGLYQNAEKAALKAARVDPSSLEIALLLGQICMGLQEYTDATNYYNRVANDATAQERTEIAGEAFAGRGQALMMQGQFARAAPSLMHAASLVPNSLFAAINQALGWEARWQQAWSEGKIDDAAKFRNEAHKALDDAALFDPEDPDIQRIRTRLIRRANRQAPRQASPIVAPPDPTTPSRRRSRSRSKTSSRKNAAHRQNVGAAGRAQAPSLKPVPSLGDAEASTSSMHAQTRTKAGTSAHPRHRSPSRRRRPLPVPPIPPEDDPRDTPISAFEAMAKLALAPAPERSRGFPAWPQASAELGDNVSVNSSNFEREATHTGFQHTQLDSDDSGESAFTIPSRGPWSLPESSVGSSTASSPDLRSLPPPPAAPAPLPPSAREVSSSRSRSRSQSRERDRSKASSNRPSRAALRASRNEEKRAAGRRRRTQKHLGSQEPDSTEAYSPTLGIRPPEMPNLESLIEAILKNSPGTRPLGARGPSMPGRRSSVGSMASSGDSSAGSIASITSTQGTGESVSDEGDTFRLERHEAHKRGYTLQQDGQLEAAVVAYRIALAAYTQLEDATDRPLKVGAIYQRIAEISLPKEITRKRAIPSRSPKSHTAA